MEIVTGSAGLRVLLSMLAREYARRLGIVRHTYLSLAKSNPILLFKPYENGTKHGNFLDASYAAILADPEWRKRFRKRHSQRKHLPVEERRTARELDSCTSSDALLMNIFCHPDTIRSRGLAGLLGFGQLPKPEFGFKAGVTKDSGPDDTEIDMKLDGLLVESKLTETDFTSKPVGSVQAYSCFAETFHEASLPRLKGDYAGYQLIRNVLAARQHGGNFMLLYDARRPDLVQHWWPVVRAIKDIRLRERCHLLAWQQLAVSAPREVRQFLAAKYGIT